MASTHVGTPGRTALWTAAALVAAFAVGAIQGCENVNVTALDVAELEVLPGQSSLRPGDSLLLTAVVKDGSGRTLTNRPVSWSSDDPQVASVTSAGLVKGVGSGETRIRASAGAAEGTATVTIIAPALIVLDPASAEFEAVEHGTRPAAKTLAVRNEGSGTLGDLSVSVSHGSGASGWLRADLDASTAPTDLVLRVTRTDLRPGTYEATVRVSSPQAANSPRTAAVRLTVGARISLTRSTVTAEPASVPADGSSTSTVTVRLRGPDGEPVATGGDDVRLSLSGPGSLGPVSDEGDGRYAAVLTAPSSPGNARITARANGDELADDARVEFTAVDPDEPDPGEPEDPDEPDEGAGTLAIGYHTSGGPDGDRHLHVTITVRDRDGRRVKDAQVVAAIRNRSGGLWVRAGRTDADGRVVFSVNNHPSGCYVTTVTSLSGEGVEWPGGTPENEYCKP